jgi:hypothetical protein
MVHPGTLFIGDSGAFLCIPMTIGVKSEHWRERAPSGMGSGHQWGSGSGHHFGAGALGSPLYIVGSTTGSGAGPGAGKAGTAAALGSITPILQAAG